jgi:hypothetical protein
MFVDQGQFSDSDFISGRENVQFHDIQNIIENEKIPDEVYFAHA